MCNLFNDCSLRSYRCIFYLLIYFLLLLYCTFNFAANLLSTFVDISKNFPFQVFPMILIGTMNREHFLQQFAIVLDHLGLYYALCVGGCLLLMVEEAVYLCFHECL